MSALPLISSPPTATGTRRAILIGINYVGAKQGVLSGCHNDVNNMIEYMEDVHGFDDTNITVLLDEENTKCPHEKTFSTLTKRL